MSYLEKEEGLVEFTTSRANYRFALNNQYKPSRKPSKIAVKEYLNGSGNYFARWGDDDNLWPQTVLNAIRACAPAQVCVEILTTLFYGNGVRVYKRLGDGSTVLSGSAVQQQWFRQTNISRYLMEAAYDYFTLAVQFPQLISNRDDKKTGFGAIANISAPWCRLAEYNTVKGAHPYVFIHGNWDKMPAEKETEKVVLLNDIDADEQIEGITPGQKFMWRVRNYTPGMLHYADHPWHALVRNGTLDIFPEIPKIRKRRIANAMFIKYHVEILEEFWYLKYAGTGGIEEGRKTWASKSAEDRKKIRNQFYTEIDNKLSGSDNAFKNLFTGSFLDKNGEIRSLIKITKMETEVGESAAFDPDKMSNVADIFLSFGIPSAVANTVLSDTKSRGGGSDIREGNTSVIARLPMHRDNLLYPVDFAMRHTMVNGAPLLADDEFLGMENTVLTTLDQSKSGTQKITP